MAAATVVAEAKVAGCTAPPPVYLSAKTGTDAPKTDGAVLIAIGCDVVTVQRALGHASATTTLNTYSYLWPTAEDRTRNAAEGLVLETLDTIPADSVRTSGNQ